MNALSSVVGNIDLWTLGEITLRQPFDGEYWKDYWLYYVWFKGPSYVAEDGFETDSFARMFVLMNGKTAPLIKLTSEGDGE